jgi:glycopeptide antibiotics resistance protein
MIGNVAAFMPFGFFLPIISRRSKKWYNTVMFGFVFSLMLETLQLVFKVGSFDVDDILLNTIGGVLGYIVFVVCNLLRRRNDRKKRKEKR